MNKSAFLEKAEDYGDFLVEYITKNSKKRKYSVCTADLSTEYIANKIGDSVKHPTSDTKVLVFCWDVDALKILDTTTVKKMTPLSKVLKSTAYLPDE